MAQHSHAANVPPAVSAVNVANVVSAPKVAAASAAHATAKARSAMPPPWTLQTHHVRFEDEADREAAAAAAAKEMERGC